MAQPNTPMTEVILKSKIEGLGAEADVVKVRPGYARNFLLPRGLAMPSTQAYKAQIEKLKKARAEREAAELNDAAQIAARINKMTITFQMNAAEGQDKVFGSVTIAEIVERLSKEQVELDRKKVKLAHPLKELGEHKIEIAVHHDVVATLKVVLALPKSSEQPAEEVSAKGKFKSGKRPERPAKKKEDEVA